MKNTKQTEEALRFILSLANVLSDVASDGKFSLVELPKLVAPLRLMPAAIKDAGEIVAEFKDLSKEEVDSLVAIFVKEFDLKQEAVEMMIEKGILVLAELAKIALSFKK